MTALKDLLIRQIKATGPITIADYMTQCLLHPEHGYYAQQEPFGTAGDFITAPEISQMFGELLGLCLAQCWLDQGAPQNICLAELGPGRGTLMADMLRATRSVPGFHAAAQVVLVEASERLCNIQRATLAGTDVTWVGQIEDLPAGPLFLVANEFFDALPIRQFQRSGAGWRERVIGHHGPALQPGLTETARQAALEHRLDDCAEGDIVETCAPGNLVMQNMAAQIAAEGGAALIIDYGDWRSLGDTLQALKAHQPVDPFGTPGQADLTAHVDFEALATASAPAKHTRLTPQGVFLERLGITARAQALAAHLSGEALNAHIAAHRRLTHPDEMGSLFKVLGLYPAHANPPPGLEP